METTYHVQLTQSALAPHFTEAAIDEVVSANIGQDALRYQLGKHPHFHFDNNRIAEGNAYVEAQHARVVALAGGDCPCSQGHTGAQQREALGRLLHAAQDFYAHANYVDLWLDQVTHPGSPPPPPETIDALDPALLTHPDLITGSFVYWRDLIYLVPFIGRLARRIWVPPTSHEGMNLDGPGQGWKFAYALEAARQRTRHEVARALDGARAAGGEAGLRAFAGRG